MASKKSAHGNLKLDINADINGSLYNAFAHSFYQVPASIGPHHMFVHGEYLKEHPEVEVKPLFNRNGEPISTPYTGEATRLFSKMMDAEAGACSFTDYCNIVRDLQMNYGESLDGIMSDVGASIFDHIRKYLCQSEDLSKKDMLSTIRQAFAARQSFLLPGRGTGLLESMWWNENDKRFKYHVPSDLFFEGLIDMPVVDVCVLNPKRDSYSVASVYINDTYAARIADAGPDEVVCVGSIAVTQSAMYVAEVSQKDIDEKEGLPVWYTVHIPIGVVRGCDFLLLSDDIVVTPYQAVGGGNVNLIKMIVLTETLALATRLLRDWYGLVFMRSVHPVGDVFPDGISTLDNTILRVPSWDIRRADIRRVLDFDESFNGKTYTHGSWDWNGYEWVYAPGHWSKGLDVEAARHAFSEGFCRKAK